jgi:hypothetical protein
MISTTERINPAPDKIKSTTIQGHHIWIRIIKVEANILSENDDGLMKTVLTFFSPKYLNVLYDISAYRFCIVTRCSTN